MYVPFVEVTSMQLHLAEVANSEATRSLAEVVKSGWSVRKKPPKPLVELVTLSPSSVDFLTL
jgi:hypothetical protein